MCAENLYSKGKDDTDFRAAVGKGINGWIM